MAEAELLFVPLGGVGEIGMNLALYGYGPKDHRSWIMVDCGVTFPDAEHPGADLVMADTQFAEGLGKALKAIVVTHAHEDHFGALLALWPKFRIPVWCTPFTAGLLEAKANDEPDAPKIPVSTYKAGDRFNIGPFAIEAIHVAHSIPEPVALAIATPAGTVIHTGDWKIDAAPSLGANTDAAAFARHGDKGVLALVCDSTNALHPGISPTETAVSESLAEIIANARGRVAITTFSSNVGRIRSVAFAAKKAGRRVMLMGRSLRRVVDVAESLGMLDGLDPFVEEDEFQRIDRRNLVMILTGSQGEDRAALAKLARDEHPRIHLSPGDTVIYSSRAIPGNEKAIGDTRNRLIEQGIEIVTDEDALVHVSGHPRRAELEEMYRWTRPRISVPVHGEAQHLAAHAQLAGEMGVPERVSIRNGDILRLFPGEAAVVGKAPAGRTYLDGKVIGNEETTGIADRRKLSHVGIVACSVVLDRDGRMADDLDLVAIGLPANAANGEPLEDLLGDAAEDALNSLPAGRRRNDDAVSMAVEKAVRAAARDHWGKKPVVTVFVARV
jgi:ribonuclease J